MFPQHRSTNLNDFRWRRAQSIANMGFWELDLENDILYWCEMIYRIFGVDPAKFQPSYDQFLQIVHPEDRESVHNAYQHSVATGLAYNIVHRLLLDSGEIKWVNERGHTIYSKSGTPIGSLGTVTDITEFKLLEQRLHHSQRIEALGKFACGIAHDINNFLSTISIYLEVLQQKLEDQPELHPALAGIASATQRCTGLGHSLLAFGSNRKVETMHVHLIDVITSLLPIIETSAGPRIVIDLEVAEDCPPVLADPNELSQVVINLVLNARDAMHGAGKLTIRCRPSESKLTRSNQLSADVPSVELTVSDDGPGMPADIRSKIFDPLFTTKGPSGNTGLGLSIVHEIVRRHDGVINVSSTPEGTQFTVLLPAYHNVASDDLVST